MIDNYFIAPERGYVNQVGLYIQAKEQKVQQFYKALQEAGFECVRGRKTPNRPEFNHFAYVSIRNEAPGKAIIEEKLSEFCTRYCASIDDYHIDPRWGRDEQVGLYIRGEEQAVHQFNLALQRFGFRCFSGSKIPDRAEFNYFAYVSMPNKALDKPSVAKELLHFCKQYCPSCPSSRDTPSYDTWRVSFDAYVQTYQKQHFDDATDGLPSDVFDKAHAYNLIASAHYDEAETYVQRFADDVPPTLVPIYLVYLYHEWQCPKKVTAAHDRYEDLFRASDPDHRVVLWIAEAYVAQQQPKRALTTLEEFLPEFQRQGVADELLELMMQIKG